MKKTFDDPRIGPQKCYNCGRPLERGKEVWLEMDGSTGKLYYNFPDTIPESRSQGCFAFGPDCARQVAADKPVKS